MYRSEFGQDRTLRLARASLPGQVQCNLGIFNGLLVITLYCVRVDKAAQAIEFSIFVLAFPGYLQAFCEVLDRVFVLSQVVVNRSQVVQVH